MTYDPSRKRKGGLPKSIISKYGITKRAWQVFRGGRGRSSQSRGRKPRYDPAPARKTYKVGRRRRRYDLPAPARRGGWGGKARGALAGVERNLQWLGVALGLLIPAEICRASHNQNLMNYYVNQTKTETMTLFGKDPRNTMDSLTYIQFKFTSPMSAWRIPFWGSLIAQIATRFGALKPISPRANAAIRKLSLGTLIASIFGALFLGGGGTAASSTSTYPASSTVPLDRRTAPIEAYRNYNVNTVIGGAF